MSVREKIITTMTPEGEQEQTRWWIADYRDGSGKRHQERFKRKAEAKAREETQKVAIRAGTHVSLDNNLTVADVAEKWIKRVEANERERATVRQYREHIKLHIVPRLGAVTLAKLTKGHVEGFRDGLISGVGERHKALSRPMAHKVLRSFKSMLKVVRCSHLADDVKVEIDKRKKRKLEVGRDIPTTEEVGRMVKAAKQPKMRALLMMATTTGLRASELRGLRWSDVDLLKARELHVRQRADRWNKIGPPKSESSRRTIPLGPELILALKEWKIACPKNDLDLVFPTKTGAIEHHKNMIRSLAPVMKAAHVLKNDKPKYALHAFRHFFASWCINPADRGGRELPAKVVQTLLGHSSIMMTLDVYGHLFRDKTDKAELAASEKALFG
jgi:integrase